MAIAPPKTQIHRDLFGEVMFNGHLLDDEYMWDHAVSELVVRLGILRSSLAVYESLAIEPPDWMPTLNEELQAHLQRRLA